MNRFNFASALLAGVLSTAAMTLLTMIGPMMGMSKMDIPGMLSEFMGMPIAMGWIAHFMIGSILAIVYALVFQPRLKGPGYVRGMLFSLIPWAMAQVLVMPMMGMGLFSRSAMMAMGSLIGHLLYGVVVGAFYRPK